MRPPPNRVRVGLIGSDVDLFCTLRSALAWVFSLAIFNSDHETDTFPDCSTAWPSGIKPVPLPMDGDGLTVNGMEQVLANWNPEEHDGMQR